MSSLIVEVCEIAEVKPHPNADRLEIVVVKGWQTCVQKTLGLKKGDPVVYFPPDTVMPESLADRLGIKKYLSPVKEDVPGYRVRAARLRGRRSYGTIDHEVNGFKVGDDVTKHYGVWKYIPKVRYEDGELMADPPTFHSYTDIQHIANFPNVFYEGEEVVVTEKIHGASCRLGLVRVPSRLTGKPKFRFVAGSLDAQRRKPGFLMFVICLGREIKRQSRGLFRRIFMGGERVKKKVWYNPKSRYWTHMTPQVQRLLRALSAEEHDVVIFGEIFGSGIQDMHYGLKNGEIAFQAFDVSVDGRYLDFDAKRTFFDRFAIPTVPLLYRGEFYNTVIEDLTDGSTQICLAENAGPFKGREGVVITPVVERRDPAIGRVILKSVSVDYLSRKGGTDD